MTREEARKAAEVMLAYADGKEIQVRDQGGWGDCNSPSFNWDGYPDNYRIKPTPTYRPFNNAEECWEEMQKHEPFGWVQNTGDGHYTLIHYVNNEVGFDGLDDTWSYYGTMINFTFADGQPFGKLTEEE